VVAGAYALVMEAWPSGKRALLAGIIGTGFQRRLPAHCARWVSAFTSRGSRGGWIMIAGAAPALLALAIQVLVPESERWKAAVKARAARPVHEILSSGLLTKTLLGIGLASVALIGTWGSVQWLPLWADQMTGGRVPTAKGDDANPRQRRGDGRLPGRRACRWPIGAATGLFRLVPAIAACSAAGCSVTSTNMAGLPDFRHPGGRSHGGLLRLAAALPAGACSHPGARDWPGPLLQLQGASLRRSAR